MLGVGLVLGSRLTSVEEVCGFTSLEKLSLRNHFLEEIPDCIASLENLVELDLSM